MENNPMLVPTREVFPFVLIKKPMLSAIWYSVFVLILMIDFDTVPLLISCAILLISFTKARFFLALLSPLPCIATVVVSFVKLNTIGAFIITVLAVAWFVLFYNGMKTWRHVAKGEYVISPISNRLMYEGRYFLMSGLKGNKR